MLLLRVQLARPRVLEEGPGILDHLVILHGMPTFTSVQTSGPRESNSAHAAQTAFTASHLRIAWMGVQREHGDAGPRASPARRCASTYVDAGGVQGAQSIIGCELRTRHIVAHAAWISVQRIAMGPALVIPVRRSRSELECSPGVRPRYDCTRCAVANRPGSSIVATKRSAVTGPIPGIRISRRHTSCSPASVRS